MKATLLSVVVTLAAESNARTIDMRIATPILEGSAPLWAAHCCAANGAPEFGQVWTIETSSTNIAATTFAAQCQQWYHRYGICTRASGESSGILAKGRWLINVSPRRIATTKY